MIPVSVRNIVKTFGRVRALDDVSLDIERGELFFLLGPSGCGKTTLLRTIAGFYDPDGGRVLFGERDVTHMAAQRRNTGMVFQNYALWPHMTVEANVAFGLKVRRVSRQERRRRVLQALETVRMAEYARRKPNQLSGGQQQRVALARALVIRPQCLLLDEPLSNLDAKLRLDMRGEIRRLCKEAGLTGIYVTHDQKEALSIADRMAVMFNGRIGQVGAPRELYRNPGSAAIADFLGETNFLDAAIEAAHSDVRLLSTPVGPLRAISGADAPRGGACTISIRPEALLVAEPGAREDAAGRSICVHCSAALPPLAVYCPQCGSILRAPVNGGDAAVGQAGASPAAPQPQPGAVARNWLRGQVESCTYLGEAMQVIVQIGATTMRATVAESGARGPLHVGTEVAVAVDPRDVVILQG